MTHTNTAVLYLSAAELIALTGRLQEHELWDEKDLHKRSMIERGLLEQANKIADWFGCDLVKREKAQEAA